MVGAGIAVEALTGDLDWTEQCRIMNRWVVHHAWTAW